MDFGLLDLFCKNIGFTSYKFSIIIKDIRGFPTDRINFFHGFCLKDRGI